MSERCNGHIVVHVQAQAGCPSLRGIGLALIDESLGHLAHVTVEDALQAVHPSGSELAAAVLVDSANIAFQQSGHLTGVKLLVTVGHAGVHLVGYHTVFAPYVGHVLGSATFSEVDRAIHADVLDGLVIVAVVNYKTLTQVNLLAGEAQDLVLEE